MSAQTILTLSNGTGYDLLDPPKQIDFYALAEALAKEARYNGATPWIFYSVAEHSVRCADAAFDETGDKKLAAYLLLHDGHEGVLKDDTTPKKRAIAETAQAKFGILASQIMDAFAELTDKQDVVIHAAAGLDWPPDEQTLKAIKYFDVKLFVTEWRDLMNGNPHPNWKPYSDVDPLEVPILPMKWTMARAEFLNRCERYLPKWGAQ